MANKPFRGKKLKEAERWYDANQELLGRVAKTIQRLLRNVLRAEKIDFVSITARKKERHSFLQKASKRKYKVPATEIKDVAGIRVVTYFDSVARKVGDVIEQQFEIDHSHSLDKSKLLGTDRVGYRSVHYIAKLKPDRLSLSEYKDFSDIWFEIQVRSILQHAWAEIEHDRRFKFPGELPASLQRRFSILAGNLEMADREFDSIATEIDSYTTSMPKAAAGNKSKQALTLVDLSAYLTGLYKEKIKSGSVEPGLGGGDGGKGMLEELKAFGVKTLGQLADLVPRNFEDIAPGEFSGQTTFIGIVRTAMLLRDPVKYFESAWTRDWNVLDIPTAEALRARGVDMQALVKKYGFSIEDLSAEEEEVDGGWNEDDDIPF